MISCEEARFYADAPQNGIRATITKLLAERARGATICPSEVARLVAGTISGIAETDWREAMPAVHAAIDDLMAEGIIDLSWKGKTLAHRAGPYRIGTPKE